MVVHLLALVAQCQHVGGAYSSGASCLLVSLSVAALGHVLFCNNVVATPARRATVFLRLVGGGGLLVYAICPCYLRVSAVAEDSRACIAFRSNIACVVSRAPHMSAWLSTCGVEEPCRGRL